MKGTLPRLESELAEAYETTLREYFNSTRQTALERAYQVGRRALAEGPLLAASPPLLTAEERLEAEERYRSSKMRTISSLPRSRRKLVIDQSSW